MDDSTLLREILDGAYKLMCTFGAKGPAALARMLDLSIQAAGVAVEEDIAASVRRSMLSEDPNDPVRGQFGRMLRAWDHSREVRWAGYTEPNSHERREKTYDLLELSAEERLRANFLIPIADLRNSNLVVGEDHAEWFVEDRRQPGFYWEEYRKYLKRHGWDEDGIEDLGEASDMVLERLSDPFRMACYQTKGIVVGYVQSGKTANFTAVVAKASDAGYRLIIVLGGVLDILRSQTQRRIDKELIGKEIIESEAVGGVAHEYANDRDWADFVSHGGMPRELGYFDFNRLTGIRDDYQSARRHGSSLEFLGQFADRHFNHPDNIRHSEVRLVVMKKNPARIAALRKDLERLRHTDLAQVPTLIIDDESDQASVNTRRRKSSQDQERTATNREIVALLRSLPRAQYVGYTATPFANVFVDPDDAADLFPKDFMVALKRPAGYMGVRDFFDFDEAGRSLSEDELPMGYESNQRAYLRDIRNQDGETDDQKEARTLLEAIDCFVLSGAIKLFRQHKGVQIKLRHHTMLVHRSTQRAVHSADQTLVQAVFDGADYCSLRANARLEELWEKDFKPVSEVKAPDIPVPASFTELNGFIDAAVNRIRNFGGDSGAVRVVNAEPGYEEQVPDFDSQDVWSILVGGAKLSRGFTVEGLTVSYFRRSARTADTLMQTGRWFGFRRGYHDLVRVFLGREERVGKSTLDLQEAFKAICMDEEVFRAQLRRYMERGEGEPRITPKQIPPLVPQHLLQPTATNKMYNHVVAYLNFGGQWKESTPQPTQGSKCIDNAMQFRLLFEGLRFEELELGLTDPDSPEDNIRWPALVAEASPRDVLALLNRLAWTGELNGYVDERRFMDSTGDLDPGIARFLIIAPQQQMDVPVWNGGCNFKVVGRKKYSDTKNNSRFSVFSERRHRLVAEAISRVGEREFIGLTPETSKLSGPHTAVLLFYPTIEKDLIRGPTGRRRADQLEDGQVTMGFGLQFPENSVRRLVVFGVRNRNKPEDVVVSAD